MEDSRIVELYWERAEAAIAETEMKYGRYCYRIAYNILYCPEDAQECVNDTYINAWHAMPPQKPQRLSAFLGRITRNIALNRYAHERAQKRYANMELVLDEAQELVPDPRSVQAVEDEIALRDAINSFVAALPRKTRIIFVRRYWYLSPIGEIAKDYRIPEGTVKSILSRTRRRFRAHLEKEGVWL